jgi:hypothetical protein
MTNPTKNKRPAFVGRDRRRINDGYLDMPFEVSRGVSLDDMRTLCAGCFKRGRRG